MDVSRLTLEPPPEGPLVIGHRGASGYRPEHTTSAYELAMALGADLVEPDVVATADGMLVCRHENELSETTDIAAHPEFGHRMTTKWVGGVERTGWFTEDFTLAELKTLGAKERFPVDRPLSASYDGKFSILSLDDLIRLVRRTNEDLGTSTGICIEFKHPSYFRRLGLNLDQLLGDTLVRCAENLRGITLLVESGDRTWLRSLGPDFPLPRVQLIEPSRPELTTTDALRDIATYAQAIAPHHDLVVAPGTCRDTGLVAAAHAQGLAVLAWTLRSEDDSAYVRLLASGIDGVFTDYPDRAVGLRAHARDARRSGVASR